MPPRRPTLRLGDERIAPPGDSGQSSRQGHAPARRTGRGGDSGPRAGCHECSRIGHVEDLAIPQEPDNADNWIISGA